MIHDYIRHESLKKKSSSRDTGSESGTGSDRRVGDCESYRYFTSNLRTCTEFFYGLVDNSVYSLITALCRFSDYALVREMDLGKLTVRIFQIELNRTGRSSRSAANLSNLILKPMRQVDARTVDIAGYRIANRLASGFKYVGNDNTANTIFDVDL